MLDNATFSANSVFGELLFDRLGYPFLKWAGYSASFFQKIAPKRNR
jgi:hypothetical protein